MTQAAKTKEELFLERFSKLSDSNDFMEIDEVAAALQLNPKNLKTIIRLLCQGNFIKKRGDAIRMTDHGHKVVAAI